MQVCALREAMSAHDSALAPVTLKNDGTPATSIDVMLSSESITSNQD